MNSDENQRRPNSIRYETYPCRICNEPLQSHHHRKVHEVTCRRDEAGKYSFFYSLNRHALNL